MKNCSELLKKIKNVYGNIPKYRYERYNCKLITYLKYSVFVIVVCSHEEMSEDHVAFKMLHKNSSKVNGKF